MEKDTVNLYDDIKKYSYNYNKTLYVNNAESNINLIKFTDINITNIIKEWQIILGIMGKSEIFKSHKFTCILYCLLTNNSLVNNDIDINIYDQDLDRLLNIDIINKIKKTIKIKPSCNTQIIFCYNELNKYKIYELYNTKEVIEYFGDQEINFNNFIKNLNLHPIFTSSISNIDDDFHKLSLKNIELYKNNILKIIKNLEINNKKLENRLHKFLK